MADSARMRRSEPVSAAELAPVEGSADLVPQEHMSQEHMSQAQLMQLQALRSWSSRLMSSGMLPVSTRCRLRTFTWCVCSCWWFLR